MGYGYPTYNWQKEQVDGIFQRLDSILQTQQANSEQLNKIQLMLSTLGENVAHHVVEKMKK